MLKNMPEGMQQIMDRSLRQAMHEGIPKAMQKQEQDRKTSIEVHYYHCDHLGTPLALTDREAYIAGAEKLDPWGNLEEEYNPKNIDQPIRLPGQHHDRETGLFNWRR